MADKVLERPVAREAHPKIQIIAIQRAPARKQIPIRGSMGARDRKNEAMDRMDEPPGENGYEPKSTSDGWVAEPRWLPRTGSSMGEEPMQTQRP